MKQVNLKLVLNKQTISKLNTTKSTRKCMSHVTEATGKDTCGD